ncbi:hypothetical protein SKAU_G00146600 [Synaphobranchus kaupii]|uniref:Uncharacterized protein n=1 Tax=Synaphobranchus kaupii TaxID=118154 RepID=A0A9Q1FTQ3_SYNKA|nr:hypothetical protein SKAU_G00146600 [Synaphobranchus kaupii]
MWKVTGNSSGNLRTVRRAWLTLGAPRLRRPRSEGESRPAPRLTLAGLGHGDAPSRLPRAERARLSSSRSLPQRLLLWRSPDARARTHAADPALPSQSRLSSEFNKQTTPSDPKELGYRRRPFAPPPFRRNAVRAQFAWSIQGASQPIQAPRSPL